MERIICEVCHNEISDPNGVHRIRLFTTDYVMCEWDALRISDYLMALKTHHVSNIFWGSGHVSWTCWETIRSIIREYRITEVLEFGIGLSSELFVNEGLKVVGFDACEPHIKQYQELLPLKNEAKFHHYEYGADGPPAELLYPGRKWDFVFVDGPQERAKEVEVAMRVANRFIYLHDPNLGEQSFFPNPDWVGIGTEPRLFIKKEFYVAG